MKLFFFKPKKFNPLLIFVSKISSTCELEKIETMSNDIFHILMDNKDATEENILIFSIIKDYDKTTTNLILPSTKSNQILTNRCHIDTKFMNMIVNEILINSDTEYYLELIDSKIKMHMVHLNLMSFANFYSIK
jgi:hypothetical protein